MEYIRKHYAARVTIIFDGSVAGIKIWERIRRSRNVPSANIVVKRTTFLTAGLCNEKNKIFFIDLLKVSLLGAENRVEQGINKIVLLTTRFYLY